MEEESSSPGRVVPELTSAQRRFLRGRAHALEPVVQIGRAGITKAVIASIDRALAAHELIKVRLHEPADKRAAASALAERSAAALCGLIGHTVILFRPDPERPRITLP